MMQINDKCMNDGFSRRVMLRIPWARLSNFFDACLATDIRPDNHLKISETEIGPGVCDCPGPIYPSKSCLQILWLLPHEYPSWNRAEQRGEDRVGASEDSDLPLYLAGWEGGNAGGPEHRSGQIAIFWSASIMIWPPSKGSRSRYWKIEWVCWPNIHGKSYGGYSSWTSPWTK
jgi:hypothetical protein